MIYQFFVFIKVCIWYNMLLMRFSRNSSSIIHYIFNNHDFNFLLILLNDSWNNEISEYCRWSWSLRWNQSYSIEFMSNELENQIIMENSCFFVNWSRIFLVFSAIYDRALSCWNTIFVIPSAWRTSKKDNNWSWRMMMQTFLLTISSINIIESSLLLKKHFYIIYETSSFLLLFYMFFDA